MHNGAKTLRNPLELLLSDLDEPSRIINKFAKYAGEKPVKARPYEAIWDELVGGTGGAELIHPMDPNCEEQQAMV